MTQLQGLKGLTDQDRATWEQRYASDLAGRSKEDIDRIYVHAKFRQKYGASDNFAVLDRMSAAEKEEYWNSDYDQKIEKLKPDSYMQRMNRVATTSSDTFKDSNDRLEEYERKYGQLSFDDNKQYTPEDIAKFKKIDSLEQHFGINTGKIPEDIRQQISEDQGVEDVNQQIVENLKNDPEYADWKEGKEGYTAMMEEAKRRSEAYQQEAAKVDSGRANKDIEAIHKNIKDIANAVSPYYRKYKDKPEYLTFTPMDWRNISTEFEKRRRSLGENAALEYLQAKIQNEVEKNTSWLESTYNGWRNMGASAVGSTVAFAGMVKGAIDYIDGEHEDAEGASGFTNFIDAIVDNSWTRYGNDIIQWGSMMPDQIQKAKDIGLSDIAIVDTYENTKEDASFWDIVLGKNTLANLQAQYGFTLASLGEGAILQKGSKMLFRAAKGRALRSLMSQNAKNLTRAKQVLQGIQKVEGYVDKAVIPGLVGEGEAVIEALDTKQRFLEEGQKLIAEKQQEFVDHRFQELLASDYDRLYAELTKSNTFVVDNTENFSGHSEGHGMSPQEAHITALNMLYQQAWDEYGDAYQASVDDLNYNAARAARTTFMLNSGINGLLNTTLRSTWFDSNLQGKLKSSRLFGRASSGPKVDVNTAGKASVKYPWYKKAWNYAKEPIGEGTEEITQSLAQGYSRGKSMNNLENFVQHKYKNDADVTVGDVLWEDYAAGLAAVGDSFMDRDTWVSGFYGAASSIVGGVHSPRRARRAGGSKGGVFERGVNAAGNKESVLEMAMRMAPWRSSIGEAHRNIQARTKEAQEMADALQAWLDNPENRAKFDGLTGTLNWARDMQRSADEGDEFGFRNSAMGKSINDALMLQTLKNTEYYNAYMREINEVAQMDEDSGTAASYIHQAKTNIAEFADKSDHEVFEQLKSNANKVLENMEKVQAIGDKLANTVGNLDIDTKEALIYGEMMMDDWKKRSETLENELNEIGKSTRTTASTVSNSTANDKVRRAIAVYGSVKAAAKAKEEFKKSIEESQKRIDKVHAKTTADKQALQAAKKALKEAKDKYQLMDKYEDMDSDAQVLSEEDIMNLDPVSRAAMLNPKNHSKYSAEQQAVIDNLVQNGTSIDPQFVDKVLDAGHIRQAMQSYTIDYAKTISDPESFSVFAKNAKMSAIKEGYAKRYNAINNSKTYDEFADKMDKLIVQSTPYEQDLILKKFARENKTTPNEYYQRYIASREKAADVLKEASKGQVLAQADGNTADLFTYATSYLTRKGVDITNANAVTAALSEQNEQGNLFQQYVAAMNEDADDASRVNFTDIGSIIQMYKDVISEFNKNTADRMVNSTSAQPVDKAPTNNAVNTAEKAAQTETTLAKAAASNEPAVTSTTTAVNGTGDAVPASSAPVAESTSEIAKLFEQTSSAPEVVEYVQMIENAINARNYSEEQKAELRDILKGLSESFYDTAQSLYTTCVAKENSLRIENKDATAKNLHECCRTALTNLHYKANRERRAKELQERNSGGVLSKSAVMARFVGAPRYAQANKDANSMATISLQFLREKCTSDPAKATPERKYSPILSYLEKYNVDAFLGNDDSVVVHKTPVYFMFDPALADEQRRVYEEQSLQYTDDMTPLIAVVESKNGPIVIGDKHYQPIGAMHANGVEQSGSNRVAAVRRLINTSAEQPYLIADSQGVIQSTLSEPIEREKPKMPGQNTPVIEASMRTVLSPQDIAELEKMPVEERLKDPRYQKARKDFLKKVQVKQTESGRKQLVIEIDGLTAGVDKSQNAYAVSEVRNSLTRDGKSIVELLQKDDSSVLQGNSRIRRWSSELSGLVDKFFDTSTITLTPDGALTDDSQKSLDDFASTLDQKLGNFLFPNGWKYKLTVDSSTGDVTLSMMNSASKEVVDLGNITKGMDDAAKLTILKNMVLDKNGDVRMTDNQHGVVKWQVEYADFEKKDDKQAQANAKDIYDDNILNAYKPRNSYAVSRLFIAAPYDMHGKRQPYSYPQNTDNATTNDQAAAKVSESQVTANGVTIDGDTGSVVGGTNTAPKNRNVAAAQKAGAQMQKLSSGFTITPTGHAFNGVFYEKRSVLQEDETLKTIGAEMKSFFDAVLRGIEAGQPKNMMSNAAKKFSDQVSAFRNQLIADGITLLSESTTVIWKSQQPDGDKLSDNVYFGYDEQGNWHVFYPVVTTEKLSKEDLNALYEYVAMMSQTMATANSITVSSVNIVPIQVSRPRKTHSVVDGQVMNNVKSPFTGAAPSLRDLHKRPISEIKSYAQIQEKLGIDKAIKESAQAIAEEGVSESALLEDEAPLYGDTNMFDDMFDTPTPSSSKSAQGQMPATYVESSQQWGKFEGLPLDVEATVKALTNKGITEEAWNNMSSQERMHELDCLLPF